MGVKGRAAFAIIFIIVFICSLWLHGGLENWDYCLKVYIQNQQSPSLYGNNVSEEDMAPLGLCPGQKFQVGVLLMHLQAAPVSTDDVLLEPYLASWDELIKFMDSLGPLVGFISQEIEAKTSIIRELAQKEAELKGQAQDKEATAEEQVSGTSISKGEPTHPSAGVVGRAYTSVHSMIKEELAQGLVDFTQPQASGCRTLLRLHRALLWLQLFLSSLAEEQSEAGRARSPSELCRDAYRVTLAQHHTWWVRKAAEIAFVAMPDRAFFYRLVCVDTQKEAAAILNRVVRAIQKVYNRTQIALEEHGMLELP
ncbi:glycolipid transfer protein domain-containing protein 2 isoform X2 [Colossoma macropomum]|uniref:glycolipid transfer protein domain-containing protein 2 isoform X2 n=1 Tax=Colossoma macropomum TaxID=42526 RepID=UPI001863DDDB|nr:glycolipid transfer protein domain-containing protein 2 isoform X2 [Colossoma macropomum]